MKVLVIGSGGREHALIDAILRSKKVSKVYVAPGNGGINEVAEAVFIAVNDINQLKKFALENEIDWTVVGPELPLTLGIVDEFHNAGLKIFGVNKASAQLEGSKKFSKDLLKKYNIPTAEYEVFTEYDKAQAYIEQKNKYPIVVKADGLAAGKGVYISQNLDEALNALSEIFVEKKFGGSGEKIVVEEFLDGKEISAFAFSDGETVLPLIYAQDYKKIYEKDLGPNTGGMGSYTPVSFMTDQLQKDIYKSVLVPTIEALKMEGITYQGILYAGLMIDKDEAKVLEFNVRFGDPEAQVILPLLKTDIIDIFEAIHTKSLHEIRLEWDSRSAVCVVLASKGYPDAYDTGFPISGLDKAGEVSDVKVFHAGTKKNDNNIVTSGGRVINVVAIKDQLDEAYKTVYQAVDQIAFDGMYYRKDIALKEIEK